MINSLAGGKMLILCFILLVSILFMWPLHALSAGTIVLNKNNELNITQGDSESKGGGPELRPEGFVLFSPNNSYADKSQNTLKAASTVAIGRVKYWAKLSTQFTVARGSGNNTYGKARVTVYGGHYKGLLNTVVGACGVHALIYMSVSDADNVADILDYSLNKCVLGVKEFDQPFEKSIELTLVTGKTYTVEVGLETRVNGVNMPDPIFADFYSNSYGVKYDGIKVTILNAYGPASGPGKYR